MKNKDRSQQTITFPVVLTFAAIHLFSLLLILSLLFISLSRNSKFSDLLNGIGKTAPTQVALPGDFFPNNPAPEGINNSEWIQAWNAIRNGTPNPASIATLEANQQPAENPAPTPTEDTSIPPSGGSQLISSPLKGVKVKELPSMVTQAFQVPPPGEDTGHHGVDFAFWQRANQGAILGTPITSVFAGKVAVAQIKDDRPYGYLVIIETPLSNLPADLVQSFRLENQSPPSPRSDRLACPENYNDQWNNSSKSLYVLVAHMNRPPSVKVGDLIKAGQVVGEVGNTGLSSGPHLHLEMRVGPSGVTFESMGHYDPSTTELERHNYCNWRISGVFQLFNPMDVFTSSAIAQ